MVQQSYRFLLIHTMTIDDWDREIQAQFIHALTSDLTVSRLLGRRVRARPRPVYGGSGRDARRKAMACADLRQTMKRIKEGRQPVKHHLRAVHITPQVSNQLAKIENGVTGNQMASHIIQAPVVKPFVERSDAAVSSAVQPNQLSQHSTPDDTIQWLSANRFEKYIETFERFSGDDMLRMSRDDLIQICGDADGIRLHNALHSKTIAPKLKLYVCMGESSVYTAVFLRQHSSCELLSQLVAMAGVSGDRVRDVYVEGPHAIHVRLTDDVLRHVHDEAMFSLDVVAQEGGGWVLVLKRATK
ncbi:unnamed protein product [Callosobruchus maculatus]|uniref:Uncharacterized protein n=1 Tax=Callosobruchus maculatus TaxID=64391 RepID=A0A653CZ26_CALMS|nr:unnamed protein product [Callosobruchus maculatus]